MGLQRNLSATPGTILFLAFFLKSMSNIMHFLRSHRPDRVFPGAEHGRPIGRKKLQPRNYFCTFYSFELKLCWMVELCILKKILCFLSVFDFKGFWREMTAQDLVAGKRGSRRHSTTSFSESVKVAETSYQMLESLSFCDRERV